MIEHDPAQIFMRGACAAILYARPGTKAVLGGWPRPDMCEAVFGHFNVEAWIQYRDEHWTLYHGQPNGRRLPVLAAIVRKKAGMPTLQLIDSRGLG